MRLENERGWIIVTHSKASGSDCQEQAKQEAADTSLSWISAPNRWPVWRQTEMDACNGSVIFIRHVTRLLAQWCHSLITYTFLQWGQRAKVRSVNSVHYGERKREKPTNSTRRVIFNENPGAGEGGKWVLLEQACSGFMIINQKVYLSFLLVFFPRASQNPSSPEKYSCNVHKWPWHPQVVVLDSEVLGAQAPGWWFFCCTKKKLYLKSF